MYRLGLEAILGLRKVGDSLSFDPCIPSDWEGFSLTYRHGESLYRIRVENPQRVNRGVKQVVLDGQEVEDANISLLQDGEHQVQIILGELGS